MTATETLPTEPAPKTRDVPESAPAPAVSSAAAETEVHSADQFALFWIIVGIGGICLAGLVNLLAGHLSR